MRVLVWAVFLQYVWIAHTGWAGEQVCLTMFQQKQFVQASLCFEKLMKKHPNISKLPKKQRIGIGRWLRNAAVAYKFAANKEHRVERAAYYREQAVQRLQRYLKEQLYENRYRKNSALVLQFQLQKKIGYTPLTVIANHPKAWIEITGFKFRQRVMARWSRTVRPGSYQIEVIYPGRIPRKIRRVRILSGKPALVVFSAPGLIRPSTRPIHQQRTIPQRRLPPRPGPPPASQRNPRIVAAWALLGVGVAAMITGAVTYGVGRSSENQRAEIYRQAQAQPTITHTETLFSLQQQATTLMPLGVSLLGGGGGVAVVGGLLLVLP